MASLVSLLVTDIVDSTRLWAEHEASMAADLARHDALIVRAVSEVGGRVFKHTGDGAMAVFDDPLAAARAALGIHRAIATVDWKVPGGVRVRAALHSGVVHERDGDLYGTPVNRAARLLARCPPGGVVASAALAILLADRHLQGVTVRQVGSVELRGFTHPELVFGLDADGVTPVRQLVVDDGELARVVPSLPSIDDPLIGRQGELARLFAAVKRHPLVTIVGVGGIGKTRLALEAAAGMMLEFRDGAWWCDLSAATNSGAVHPIVLDALSGRQLPGRTILQSITDRLADHRALLVLDNCEHVLGAARELVRAVRASCPDVRLLVTSRELLDVAGEHLIAVSSLPQGDAVSLFLSRARAARPDLDTGDATAALVRQICERLDGIPLAIELAAAKCRSMSPGEIHERVRDRFRLLRSGRSASERHRTLLAAVAWSHDLLDEDERDLFDRLAVFADGSLLDAVALVCQRDEYDTLELLDRLVARSMVTPVQTPLGTRYRQLETLRHFAEDQLVERGLIDEMRHRHMQWVADLNARFAAAHGTPDAGPLFRRFVAEIDNVRLAVSHAVSGGRFETAKQMVADASGAINSRPVQEVITWLDPTQGCPPWTSATQEALDVFAFVSFQLGDLDAPRRCIEMVPESERDTDALLVGSWLELMWVRGQPRAAAAVLEEQARRSGRTSLIALLLVYVDVALMLLEKCDEEFIAGALQRAAALVDEALASGDELVTATALTANANALVNAGRFDAAIAVAAEGVAVAERIGANGSADLARAALARGLASAAVGGHRDSGAVAAEVRDSIVDARDHDNPSSAVVMFDAAALLVWDDEPATAHLLAQIYRRGWALNSLLTSAPEERLSREQIAEISRAVETMSFTDAIDVAIAALDRLLASDR